MQQTLIKIKFKHRLNGSFCNFFCNQLKIDDIHENERWNLRDNIFEALLISIK